MSNFSKGENNKINFIESKLLGIIKNIGISGAVGHAIEYTGEALTNLSMEGRMTVCNMSIEMGARGGMIAPDDVTFAYLKVCKKIF